MASDPSTGYLVGAEWFVADQPAAEMLAEALMLLGAETTSSSPVGSSSTSADAPDPGYRIADAIRNTCEVAAVELEIRHDTNGNPTVADPYFKLARILDQAGLIDWAAFSEETSRTGSPHETVS